MSYPLSYKIKGEDFDLHIELIELVDGRSSIELEIYGKPKYRLSIGDEHRKELIRILQEFDKITEENKNDE